METNVYEQERTTDKYLYQEGLPALTSLTVCFWVKLNNLDNEAYLFSVAASGR